MKINKVHVNCMVIPVVPFSAPGQPWNTALRKEIPASRWPAKVLRRPGPWGPGDNFIEKFHRISLPTTDIDGLTMFNVEGDESKCSFFAWMMDQFTHIDSPDDMHNDEVTPML